MLEFALDGVMLIVPALVVLAIIWEVYGNMKKDKYLRNISGFPKTEIRIDLTGFGEPEEDEIKRIAMGSLEVRETVLQAQIDRENWLSDGIKSIEEQRNKKISKLNKPSDIQAEEKKCSRAIAILKESVMAKNRGNDLKLTIIREVLAPGSEEIKKKELSVEMSVDQFVEESGSGKISSVFKGNKYELEYLGEDESDEETICYDFMCSSMTSTKA